VTTFEGLPESAVAMLKLPPVEWRAYIDGLDPETIAKLSLILSELTEAVARAEGYAEGRDLKGDHDAGVKMSNRRGKAVRKAVGYTYAGSDHWF
jgi:hypothetical protein